MRASRGYTHNKWPCCGKAPGEYGRPKAGICDVCVELIDLGKASLIRARLAGEKNYTWTEQPHWWPGYYGPYDFLDDGHFAKRDSSRERLIDAMFELVQCVSTPTESTRNRTYISSIKTEGPVIDAKHLSRIDSGYQGTTTVMLKENVRDRINDLDATIRLALQSVFKQGLHKGGSALFQLAAGELTTDDFNRKVGLDDDE